MKNALWVLLLTVFCGPSQAATDWLGMSQSFEMGRHIDDWNLVARPRCSVERYAEWDSRCTRIDPDADRAILHISSNLCDASGTGCWVTQIQTVLMQFQIHYGEQLSLVVLEAVVGGPNNGVCQTSGRFARDVRASVNHPVIDAAIAEVLADEEFNSQFTFSLLPVDGLLSNEVTVCSDYRDSKGHLQFSVSPVEAQQYRDHHGP